MIPNGIVYVQFCMRNTMLAIGGKAHWSKNEKGLVLGLSVTT